jgi:hypothetical protein
VQSLAYYAQWQGSAPDTQQHQQQQPRQHHTALDLTAGLECNAADAAEVQELLRISGDELPECITHGPQQAAFQQQQQQQAELPGLPPAQTPSTSAAAQAAAAAAAAGTASFGAGGIPRPISSSSNLSTRGGLGLRHESAGIPPALSKYYSALSSFGGLSTLTDSSNGGSIAAAAAGGNGGGGSAAAALVPCPIVFSGSRRTSKTLAVAAPGEGAGAGVNPASWLGCVGLPVLPEGELRGLEDAGALLVRGNAVPEAGMAVMHTWSLCKQLFTHRVGPA